MPRKTKFYPTDPRDLPGDNFAFVRKALTDPTFITLRLATLPKPAPESTPNALVQMLALSPEQAKRLEGADRLNFWRNGCLNVQVQHGSRAIKLTCSKAVVTDAQLTEFFAGWGWQQVNGKPYFRCTSNSLVRL